MAAGIIIIGADDGTARLEAPRTAIQEICRQIGAIEMARDVQRGQSAFVASVASQEGEEDPQVEPIGSQGYGAIIGARPSALPLEPVLPAMQNMRLRDAYASVGGSVMDNGKPDAGAAHAVDWR